MENKRKHLEFIQATINRMAGNSFLLKGWAVTLVGALFALTFKEVDPLYLLISLIVLALFWRLDSYYLSRERLFIKLYERVSASKRHGLLHGYQAIRERHHCRWMCVLGNDATVLRRVGSSAPYYLYPYIKL